RDNPNPHSYADALRQKPREIRYNDRQHQDKYKQDNPYSNNQNRPWNRYNIRKKQDDTYNYRDDEQEMYEWDIEEGSSEEIQWANNKASVLSQPRSIQKHTNPLQKNDGRKGNEIHAIKQNLAILQDIVANLAKSLEQTTTQINSSDSDSNENRQNNMTLLTAQLQELHKGIANITSSLTSINNRITKYIRQLNDIKVQNLSAYLDKNDIDILSITEIRISNKKLNFITRNKFMDHQIFETNLKNRIYFF
ncbi:hypothetical protein C1646_774704, partial [Rhizophagus diaphanus]